MERYLKNIPVERRKKLRATIEKLRDNHKAQMELLTELYCLPNKILVAKADECLKNRASVEDFLHTLEQTRDRMNQVMNIKPKQDSDGKAYTTGDFECDINWLSEHFGEEESKTFIINILTKIPSIEMNALIQEEKI